MALSFVPAKTEEAALVQALSAAAYIPAYEAVIGAIPRPALENYEDHIAQGRVWLARTEVTGEPVGVLVLEPASAGLLVYSVVVHPLHQGKGYATALLAHAETVARGDGYKALCLYTNKRMTRNVALYSRCGYVVTGDRTHPSRKGETLLDMVKHLG